jgi:cytochrome c-type biogenesis protein CcmH/NrfG
MRAALMSLRLRAPLVARAAAAPRFTAVRSLHVSARRLNANANPNANSDPEADPQLLALRQKIENHQGSREAIIKLSEIMAKKGEFGEIGR